MLYKLVAVFCILDDKSVIYIPKPQLWLVGGSVDTLGFTLLHEQIGHNGGDGRSYGCPMHLLIILTLEEKMEAL